MKLKLKYQLFLAFLAVIIIPGVIVSVFGLYILDREVVGRAQRDVSNNLNTAHMVYQAELEQIEQAFNLVSELGNPAQLKHRLRLDYLYVVAAKDRETVRSGIVAEAFRGNAIGATRLINQDELQTMGNQLYDRACMPVLHTPKSRPSGLQTLTSAMAIEYAMPFFDDKGVVDRVMYGGRILNRYFDLIDRIHTAVFEGRVFKSKPVGTVTLFQDDVRIATNVLNSKGERAIGTRVSGEVYQNVVELGQTWRHRAFVVTDWYLTAYEPIRDINGMIIGILYVGTLEAPFDQMRHRIAMVFLAIAGVALLIAVGLSLLVAKIVSRPLTRLSNATDMIAAGDLAHRVHTHARVRELQHLAESFNRMAEQLKDREDSLRITNEKLSALNRSYLDLVGMVSHEFKGILSSTTLNAYAVRDGHFGDINTAQLRALTSVTRSLDFLATTVRNFLNLSRIEKGDLQLALRSCNLRTDVIDRAIEAFQAQADEKEMSFSVDSSSEVPCVVDTEQLQIVFNNLVGNAIKYGPKHGRIEIAVVDKGPQLQVEVYNDGRPLNDEECGKLFKRFSRLDTQETRAVRGTGLGLFIARQIVERHGGIIRVCPREGGNAFVFTINKEQ